MKGSSFVLLNSLSYRYQHFRVLAESERYCENRRVHFVLKVFSYRIRHACETFQCESGGAVPCRCRCTCGPLVLVKIGFLVDLPYVCLSTMAEDERCIFCKIAQGKDEKTTLVYQVWLEFRNLSTLKLQQNVLLLKMLVTCFIKLKL